MLNYFSAILALISFFVVSCSETGGSGNSQNSTEKSSQKADTQSDYRYESTKRMALLLDSIATHASPDEYYFLNYERAKMFDSLAKKASNQESKFKLRYKRNLEYLNAGYTKKGIKSIQESIDLLSRRNANAIPKEVWKLVYKNLGIGYLRLGEQQNCIRQHSSQSCIMPIKGGGIHDIKKGSRKAIQTFKKLLKQFPNDYEAKWLLNLAYMTLDKYPDSVPEEHLIPEKNINGDSDFPDFNNIALATGVAERGLAGGCILEDFNNDGYLDIIASSFGLNDQLKYFENTGEGNFKDKTKEAGLKGLDGGLNTVQADYNNDGYMDILVLRGGWFSEAGSHPNSLLKNMGNGKFKDVTKEAGLFSCHPTQTASWGDFNNDGYLDLFIGNETTTTNPYEMDQFEKKSKRDVRPCELYLNQGDGSFTNIADSVGLNIKGFVKGVKWGDINNDAYPDLYISQFNEPNRLFLNQGGESPKNWNFKDITESAGVSEPINSFPVWFWDYNNDGYQDIFVSAYYSTTDNYKSAGAIQTAEYLNKNIQKGFPRLYKNNGDNTFTDVTKQMNLDKYMLSMGCNFGDINNDGYPDFYVGTGEPTLKSVIPNRMFLNKEGEKFKEVTMEGRFGHIQKGHGIGFGDLDNDGDHDIYAVLGGAYRGDPFQNVLYENPGFNNSWVVIDLNGKEANKNGRGARIKVVTEQKDGSKATFYKWVGTGGSFGANPIDTKIGLAKANKIITLSIKWPNKKTSQQTFKDLPVNKTLKITEGQKHLKHLKEPIFNFDQNQKKSQSHHHKGNKMETRP